MFVAELVGGILSFVYRDQVQSLVTDGIALTFDRYNGTGTANQTITLAWDTVQEQVRVNYIPLLSCDSFVAIQLACT